MVLTALDLARRWKPNATEAKQAAYADRMARRYPTPRCLELVADDPAVRYVRHPDGGFLWRATLPDGRTVHTVAGSRAEARDNVARELERKRLPRGTDLVKVREERS